MTKKFDYATPFAKTSSGIRGVSFDSATGKWVAKISYRNRRKNLGRFNTPEEATAAYRLAAGSIRAEREADAIRELKDKISFLVGPFDTQDEAAHAHSQLADAIFMDLANKVGLSLKQVDAICSRAFGKTKQD